MNNKELYRSLDGEDEIPSLYTDILRYNAAMWEAFRNVLKQKVYPRVKGNNGGRDEKWKWAHVREALYQLGFITSKENNAAFGRIMAPIVDCSPKSIEQSIKRYMSESSEHTTDKNVIRKIYDVIASAVSEPAIGMRNA